MLPPTGASGSESATSENPLEAYKRILTELISLMIAEFICSIRARVLILPEEEVKPILVSDEDGLIGNTSDDEEAPLSGPLSLEIPAKLLRGFCWQNFFLFDCGMFRAEGGKYRVMFDDVKPSFLYGSNTTRMKEEQGDRFVMYNFGLGDESKLVYDELRANFYRGWHNRHQDRVLTLPQVASHMYALRLLDDKLIGAVRENVKKYLPNGVRLAVDELDDTLVRSIFAKVRNVMSSLESRAGEDKLFDYLGRLGKGSEAD
jgi:hypothetical protein